MSRNGPTRMQWRCLVMLDRHRGNRKAAAHAAGVTDWTFRYHIESLRREHGIQSDYELGKLFHAVAASRPRRRRSCAAAPGQECMGLVA